MSKNGTSLRRVTQDPGYDTGPRFSPDGRRLAYWSSQDGVSRLCLVSVEGGIPRVVQLPEGCQARDVCWGP